MRLRAVLGKHLIKMVVSMSVKASVFAKRWSSMLIYSQIYHNNLFFFSFLFPLLDSSVPQYFVCQNKKMFHPHSLPQGLSLPVNRPEDRADNGKDRTEFTSLKITAYESFIGTVLKIPAGWDPCPALYLVVWVWLQLHLCFTSLTH